MAPNGERGEDVENSLEVLGQGGRGALFLCVLSAGNEEALSPRRVDGEGPEDSA